jgi:DNA replication protein DnaC
MGKRGNLPSNVSPSKKKKMFDPTNPDKGILNAQQFHVLKLCLEGKNAAILGSAGTGKSFLIREILSALSNLGLNVTVTASSGSAASNLACGACTLHSFMGIGLAKGLQKND